MNRMHATKNRTFTVVQLDLFEENNEISSLKKNIASLNKEIVHLKKTFNTKFHQLMKLCIDLKEENYKLSSQLGSLRKNMPEKSNLNEDLLEKLFAEAYEL